MQKCKIESKKMLLFLDSPKRGPLIDTNEPLPISEKRAKVIWQSKDKFAFLVVTAKEQFAFEGCAVLDINEVRDLEYALNNFLSGAE
jgi:hypothetical protein